MIPRDYMYKQIAAMQLLVWVFNCLQLKNGALKKTVNIAMH